jgi:hypothetical protein
MPLWVSLIAANYDMRRYAASGDAGNGLMGSGRRCLLLFKAVGPVGQILEISKIRGKRG